MSEENDNVNTMMCLDIYLSSLTDAEYKNVTHRIKPVKTLPLISWDITGDYFKYNVNDGKEDERLNLSKLAIKYFWKLDIESLLDANYDAVVVTTASREICWANKGFTAMTGYSLTNVMGKNPNFLQGKNTSLHTRKKIKEHLHAKKIFRGTIINYRKNKEEYLCEVKIIPITNFNDEVTHFIALEKEAV